MPDITVNGILLHYEVAGDGEPFLLLHGGGGTALLHFRREIEELADSYRVIAPDLRGYGSSSPPRLFPLDFYQQDAADVAALLRALGAVPAHVCGWSDGGIAGLVLAADYPDVVRTLCVLAGQGRVLPQERDGWSHLADTDAWPDHVRERFTAAQGPLNWPDLLNRMADGYAGILAAGGEIVSRRLGRVRCPTLIVHGDDDELVPVVHAHELHRLIGGSKLQILPGAGHMLLRERHDEVLALIRTFLNEHSLPKAAFASDGSTPAGVEQRVDGGATA